MAEDRSPPETERPQPATPQPATPEGAPDLPLARAALHRRRLRDAALALQVGGVVLFVSPFVDVFAGPGRLFGLPAGALLLFGFWFALIALAAWLSPRLARDETGG